MILLSKFFIFILIFIFTSCDNNLDYVYESKKIIGLTIWIDEQSEKPIEELMNTFKSDYADINFEISLEIVEKADIFKKLDENPKYSPDVFIFNTDLTNDLIEKNYILDSHIFKLSSDSSVGIYPKTNYKKEALLLAKYLLKFYPPQTIQGGFFLVVYSYFI